MDTILTSLESVNYIYSEDRNMSDLFRINSTNNGFPSFFTRIAIIFMDNSISLWTLIVKKSYSKSLVRFRMKLFNEHFCENKCEGFINGKWTHRMISSVYSHIFTIAFSNVTRDTEIIYFNMFSCILCMSEVALCITFCSF